MGRAGAEQAAHLLIGSLEHCEKLPITSAPAAIERDSEMPRIGAGRPRQQYEQSH